jgi:hypothetical protein
MKRLNIINYQSIKDQYILNKEWQIREVVETDWEYDIILDNFHNYANWTPATIQINIVRKISDYGATDMRVVYEDMTRKRTERDWMLSKKVLNKRLEFIEDVVKLIQTEALS